MLTCFGSSDTGLGMQIVWATVIEKLYPWVGEHFPPISVVSFIAVAEGCFFHCVFVPACYRYQFRHCWWWIDHIRYLFVGIGVSLPHKGIPQHSDANLRGSSCCPGTSHRNKSDFVSHISFSFIIVVPRNAGTSWLPGLSSDRA